MKLNKIPVHLAFIMDGNGRWGIKHFNKRIAGHKKGLEVLGKTAKQSFELGVKYVSFYTFSLDNWNRSKEEVDYIHALIKEFYNKELKNYEKQKVRVLISGFEDGLNQETLSIVHDIQERTKEYEHFHLNLCFNYSGQYEIVMAAKKYAQDILDGKAHLKNVLSVKDFYRYLSQPILPPVDFMIRTSGEKRLSDFLLYQNAYAELCFIKTLWPDFNKKCLHKALKDYAQRNRKFGKE